MQAMSSGRCCASIMAQWIMQVGIERGAEAMALNVLSFDTAGPIIGHTQRNKQVSYFFTA